jgi:hypothetical protein
MKISSVGLLLVASLAFVLVGCSDNSAPIATSTSVSDNSAPSLMKTSESGAVIVRREQMVFFNFYDANAALGLYLGINDLAAACSGQSGWMDVFSYKEISLPDADPALRRMMRQMMGDDVGAIVWSSATWPINPCANVPLAEGTAHFIRTDNDFFASTQDNNNSNAWGIKANGRLVGADGQVYQLNFVVRVVWDGLDPASRKTVLKIQLTPTGGN